MHLDTEAYFHIVRHFSSLKGVAGLLYGNTDSPAARDFLRINAVAANAGGTVGPGQILYIPDDVCYAPALEADIIELVKKSSNLIRYRLSSPEAQLLAQHATLIHHAAAHPDRIKSVAGTANGVAGGLLAIAQMQTRLIGDKLKQLEGLYKHSYRANRGRLGAQFYAQRRRIYESLDSAVGRLSRTLTLGTPLDEAAKRALKVNTKSQVLHWRRHGTGGHLRDFEPHFARMARISRHLRHMGYLFIGIDGYLTYDTITRACQVDDDRDCHKAMLVDSGGFAGRTVGGAVGGGVTAYGVCNILFGVESFGSSLLWCGIVAGAVGGWAGGAVGDRIGKGAGQFIFENTYPTNQP